MFKRFAPLFVLFCLVGCGGSDKNEKNENPSQSVGTSTDSQKDVDNARAAFHLNPELQIEMKGFEVVKVTAEDTATFFKFIAKTDKIENVFTSDIDTKKFHSGFMLIDYARLGWWDVVDKEFDGGKIELPNNQSFLVGYRDNKDGTLTVYNYK